MQVRKLIQYVRGKDGLQIAKMAEQGVHSLLSYQGQPQPIKHISQVHCTQSVMLQCVIQCGIVAKLDHNCSYKP